MRNLLPLCLFVYTLLLAPLVPAQEFKKALPGYQFEFPRDHGSHPEFRTEWWYYTGNLQTKNGREFGFMMTIFRNATAPPETAASPLLANQFYLGHFAISNIQEDLHKSWEKIGRKGLGQASASVETLDVSLGDWSMKLNENDSMEITAVADGYSIALTMDPEKPFVIHGKNGAHQKANDPGQASHYISFTRLSTNGSVEWDGVKYEVSGLSWMDHEFGSNWLAEDEVGWDWFALQLENGEELMLYGLRLKDGSFHEMSSGSIIDAEGKLEELSRNEYTITSNSEWKSSHSDAVYPMGWRIEIPGKNIELEVDPKMLDQEMKTTRYTGTVYWEGAVKVSGRQNGKPVSGSGYVELVGYDKAFGFL